MANKKVIVGADPLGVELKDCVKKHLLELGYDVKDVGGTTDKDVAYYDVGNIVGAAISKGEAEFGFVFCGTGMGVNIMANKHKGVYCGLCESVQTARMCRIINNCNVLSMGGLLQSTYKANEMVDAFLNAEFAEGFTAATPEFLKDALVHFKSIEMEIYE